VARQIEKPVTTSDSIGAWKEGTRTDHPAFAQIGASRISGGAVLYGSDFQHQHFVRIRVSKSYLRRDLSNDMPMAGVEPMIEVDLSEAQWASFVSSMNTGGGTQCTLYAFNGESVPGLPTPESRKDQFKQEAIAACSKAFEAIKELQDAISDTKLSQKQKDDLLKRSEAVRGRLTGSLPFVLDQFGEHMEATVEKAKVEINAYVTQEAMRLGMNALSAPDGASPLKLQGA
jgi:hypothetical protein